MVLTTLESPTQEQSSSSPGDRFVGTDSFTRNIDSTTFNLDSSEVNWCNISSTDVI